MPKQRLAAQFVPLSRGVSAGIHRTILAHETVQGVRLAARRFVTVIQMFSHGGHVLTAQHSRSWQSSSVIWVARMLLLEPFAFRLPGQSTPLSG